ncbi:MAG: CDP-alcohol phosphatidyltransferase family protein [Candidatus Aenigmarchaeota archaeon]|nr:CDP-alcohol phosphatidyltransferase family protein [Candidatus Aenigmarchaeota archaeon]
MKEQISNALTITNLSLGFISLFFIFQGFFTQASYLIVVAVLIDCINGTIARVLKIDDDMGKNLDNISDVISFILTPAVFSYFVLSKEITFPLSYVFFALSLFFVVSGVYRTARINVEVSSDLFNGMPTTVNGLIFPGMYLLGIFSVYTVSGWMILSSVFMLSRFRIKRSFFKKKRKKESDVVEVKGEKEEEEKNDDSFVPLPFLGS